MAKCIIIEDEPMSQKALERLCGKHDELEVAAIFGDAESALHWLEENPVGVDLLFLDIEMPGLSGLDFLAQAPPIPAVIFTTGNPEYAVDAFEHRAVDFLKKPITMPRFEAAVSRALELLRLKNNTAQSGTLGQVGSGEIFVREDGRYVRISCDDILFFENVGDYVRIKTTTGQHIIYGALKGVDEKLTDPRFLKVHRSYIVNLQKIKDIEETTLVIDKTVIPISRAHRGELMSRLNVL